MRMSLTLSRSPHRNRSAFTLVELLVVIGILALLITLAVIGFKVVGSASRAKVTENQMENAKSLYAEFEAVGDIKELLPTLPVAAGHWEKPTGFPASDTLKISNCVTPARGPDADANLVFDTGRVIAGLRKSPKSRSMLENMQTDKYRSLSVPVLNVPVDSQLPNSPNTLPAITTSMVLLDGDGHPIYFVPGGGLTGVNLLYRSGDKSDAGNYDQPNWTVKAPDGRPFWASPGPDGNLITGDDNIYSFGK